MVNLRLFPFHFLESTLKNTSDKIQFTLQIILSHLRSTIAPKEVREPCFTVDSYLCFLCHFSKGFLNSSFFFILVWPLHFMIHSIFSELFFPDSGLLVRADPQDLIMHGMCMKVKNLNVKRNRRPYESQCL